MCTNTSLSTLLGFYVSSLRRGHANLLCIVPILADEPRRESMCMYHTVCVYPRGGRHMSSSSGPNEGQSSPGPMIPTFPVVRRVYLLDPRVDLLDPRAGNACPPGASPGSFAEPAARAGSPLPLQFRTRALAPVGRWTPAPHSGRPTPAPYQVAAWVADSSGGCVARLRRPRGCPLQYAHRQPDISPVFTCIQIDACMIHVYIPRCPPILVLIPRTDSYF
jgi:hypothetical protein